MTRWRQKRNDAERVAGVLTLENEALQADSARLREVIVTLERQIASYIRRILHARAALNGEETK